MTLTEYSIKVINMMRRLDKHINHINHRKLYFTSKFNHKQLQFLSQFPDRIELKLL